MFLDDIMTDRTCLSIVLAAGEGTRMKSSLPKVLHQVAGLPLVCHVVKAVQGTGKSDVALVVGRGADEVRGAVEKLPTQFRLSSRKNVLVRPTRF